MPAFRNLLTSLIAVTVAISLPGQEDTSNRTRAVSDNLAAALADTMPKFNPPPAEPEKTEEEILAEEPKNGIVRLPQIVVEGKRPPVFSERQINTDKGLKELAVKRYYSGAGAALNPTDIPFFGKLAEQTAIQMWEEDERLRRMAEFEEHADTMAILGDEEESEEVRKLARDATARKVYLPDPSALHRETNGK